MTDMSLLTMTTKLPPRAGTIGLGGVCATFSELGFICLSIFVKGSLKSSETVDRDLETFDWKIDFSEENGRVTVESRRPSCLDFAR
jgi:hypothetical protein